jgi:hypothetical protein
LLRAPRLAKARSDLFLLRSRAMTAILVIAIFLGVILALNFFEFGRID